MNSSLQLLLSKFDGFEQSIKRLEQENQRQKDVNIVLLQSLSAIRQNEDAMKNTLN